MITPFDSSPSASAHLLHLINRRWLIFGQSFVPQLVGVAPDDMTPRMAKLLLRPAWPITETPRQD